MADKGIIYIMTTVVEGLIKIGSTGSSNFEQRMYHLERNGYCNVTGLKRTFAIEVEDYKEKEALLDKIFEKSCVPNTELFALDVNIAKQLLSSFEGSVVYPKNETKNKIFNSAADDIKKEKLINVADDDNGNTELTVLKVRHTRKIQNIPDGSYYFTRNKKSDNRMVTAKAIVTNGSWVIIAGSVLGISEDAGVPDSAKVLRKKLYLDDKGVLLKDAELGICTPSCAGAVVVNQSSDGWHEWFTEGGKPINVYREQKNNYQDS